MEFAHEYRTDKFSPKEFLIMYVNIYVYEQIELQTNDGIYQIYQIIIKLHTYDILYLNGML